MKIPIFYGWWIVFACFTIALYVSSIIFFGFTALFEPLVREFGWSYTQVSFAASLRGLEMGILAPVIGYLVDRFGSRKLMLVGSVTVGLGLVMLGFTHTLFTFYGAIILISLGAGGCTTVVTTTVLAQWFRRKIGMAIGIMSSGFGAGGLLIPFVVLLVDTYGWRSAVIVFGLGMWILGIPLSLMVRDRPEPYGLLPDGDTFPLETIGVEQAGGASGKSFRDLLRVRGFWCLGCAEAIRFMVLMGVVIHIMPYLATVGMSRTAGGFVAAAIPLVSIAGRLTVGWLGDIFSKRVIMASAFIAMAAGTLALHAAGSGVGIVLFLVLFSVSIGGITVLRGSLIREYFGRESFGRIIGIVMGCAALGGVVGPTITGFVYDTTGDYHHVWTWFAGCLFMTVMLVVMIGRKPSEVPLSVTSEKT
ncbi:MAG: MFS transporter [Deltaproteobacteria bacterium]|nr:MFS transporter [Deltaproteobacteria bacterium]